MKPKQIFRETVCDSVQRLEFREMVDILMHRGGIHQFSKLLLYQNMILLC